MNDQQATLFLGDLIERIDRASTLPRRQAPITWDRSAALLAGTVHRGLTGRQVKHIVTIELARFQIREATIESETGPPTYGVEMPQLRLAHRRASHSDSPIEITIV